MSGICGWFDPASSQVCPSAITTMASVVERFGDSQAEILQAQWGAVGVVDAVFSHAHQDQHCLTVIWGDASFSSPELAQMAGDRGVAYALREGYMKKGSNVLEDLQGHFAIALLDHKKGEALLGIDRIGARPMCYAIVKGVLVFGSNLDAISMFPGIGNEISSQSIYDYMYFHMVPAPRTIYRKRERLLPGHRLVWRPSVSEIKPYWQMRFIEDQRRPFGELKQEFRTLLRTSVGKYAHGRNIGAFLSGGTDSSTIAGVLREVTGDAPRTYSIGFDEDGYDEMNYARIAARHFGAHHHEYYVTRSDVVDVFPNIALAHDQPFGNSSAVPTYYCARMAREDGIATLLAGDGGDELFGGNARYALQHLYSLYSDLPEFIRARVIEPLISLLPKLGPISKARRYITNASIPMPARYENYNLVERIGPAALFTNEFLSSIDPIQPSAHFQDTYQSALASSLINHMLALDAKFTLADNDLVKVARSTDLAGVGVAFPLLTDQVVEFALRLPPDLKLRGTKLRYFFKKALDDLLPSEIIRKSKHGFGLPFGVWVMSDGPLRNLAYDLLNGFKRKGIIRGDFIDRLMTNHLREHASYYGTLVWIFMMLEQWLSTRRVSL